MDEEEDEVMGGFDTSSVLMRCLAKHQTKSAHLPDEEKKLSFKEACDLMNAIFSKERVSFLVTKQGAYCSRLFADRFSALFNAFHDYVGETDGASPLNAEMLQAVLHIAAASKEDLPTLPNPSAANVSAVIPLIERLKRDEDEDFLVMYQVPTSYHIHCERGGLTRDNDSNTVLEAVWQTTKGGDARLELDDLYEFLDGNDELIEQVKHAYARQ